MHGKLARGKWNNVALSNFCDMLCFRVQRDFIHPARGDNRGGRGRVLIGCCSFPLYLLGAMGEVSTVSPSYAILYDLHGKEQNGRRNLTIKFSGFNWDIPCDEGTIKILLSKTFVFAKLGKLVLTLIKRRNSRWKIEIRRPSTQRASSFNQRVYNSARCRRSGKVKHVKYVYTEVDFTIGSQIIRHALDDSEPIAGSQGNKIDVGKKQLSCVYKHFTFCGTTVAERLDCSPPTKASRVLSSAGSLRIFASGNRVRRCRWSAGFLGDLPFSLPFIPLLLHTHLTSHSSALNASLLRTAQISSLILILPLKAIISLENFTRCYRRFTANYIKDTAKPLCLYVVVHSVAGGSPGPDCTLHLSCLGESVCVFPPGAPAFSPPQPSEVQGAVWLAIWGTPPRARVIVPEDIESQQDGHRSRPHDDSLATNFPISCAGVGSVDDAAIAGRWALSPTPVTSSVQWRRGANLFANVQGGDATGLRTVLAPPSQVKERGTSTCKAPTTGGWQALPPTCRTTVVQETHSQGTSGPTLAELSSPIKQTTTQRRSGVAVSLTWAYSFSDWLHEALETGLLSDLWTSGNSADSFGNKLDYAIL
ncbi:hypothetical protein PR048_020675 [Dryococelus australis]|uniref:Uncharacterized protein n=1 Tax=Dryococelus australis TaxID=614101 RepID=A0ABQ9H6Y3_9NEOP|nr:hypothetical protein PR048_020675 [Dryococelus australis]